MPLHDHFQPPFGDDWPWDAVHSAWAAAIAGHLNCGVLPPEYYALPLVKRGAEVEIDVATMRMGHTEPAGGVATAVWTPPRPQLAEVVDLSELDVFEVQVFRRLGGPQLRAAIELVSPANKDRPASRHAFAVKCASYLNRGVAVVIIDAVTERAANLHAELFEVLRTPGQSVWRSPTNLYAVAYRVCNGSGKPPSRIEAWPECLAVGQALPTLPLWLDADLSVPLDLEPTYRAACATIRAPV